MDIPYWGRCGDDVQMQLIQFIHGLLETDFRILQDSVGIDGLQDAIKMLLPNSVPSELIRNPSYHFFQIF